MNYFIYKFLNKDNEVIYVGKTNNIYARMNQHNQKKYFKNKEVVKVLLAQCNSPTDRDIYELYYINLYSPKYNDKQNYGIQFSFALPELEFYEYNDNVKLKPVKISNAIKYTRIPMVSFKYTLLEQKILLYLIHLIKYEDDINTQYILSIADLKNKLKILNGNIYTQIKNAIRNIETKEFKVNNKEEKVFSEINIIENNGCIPIIFNPKICMLLKEYKKYLSESDINILLTFKSIYSIRLYLLLMQIKNNSAQYPIKELKEIFGLSINDYKYYHDFRTKALDKAINEINNKTELQFKIKEIKYSRSIEKIEFIKQN